MAQNKPVSQLFQQECARLQTQLLPKRSVDHLEQFN
jgi:hypothetical protein